MPGAEIIPALESSLGRPVGEVFRDFETEARAGGSIGQAHRAVRLDGSRVVVKIKRPGIDAVIDDDVSLLEALADLADRYVPELSAVRPRMLAAELRRALRDELDFVGEAARASRFGESLGDMPDIAIPKMHWDLVSRDVLVMDLEEGTSLSDLSEVSPNERRRLAGVVADCFIRQYFETGVFHADPHPGNFLRRPDGTVAIIDFGLAGRLSETLRLSLGRMLLALREGNVDALAELCAEVGELSPEADLRDFRFDLGNLVERNFGIPAEQLDFSVIAQESLALARKNGLYLPRDFVLLARSLMLVAALIRDLDPGFRFDAAVIPAAKRLGERLSRPGAAAKSAWRLASRFSSLLRRLPDDFRDLIEKARAGRLTIVFRHDNLRASVERTGRSVDRLALGIIAAAVIIGSSIVFSAGQSGSAAGYFLPFLGGMSLPAAMASAGFLLALFLAIYVAWGIFRDKK